MKLPRHKSARVPAFEYTHQGCRGPWKSALVETNLAAAVRRQIRAVAIMLVIGVSSCCGCTSVSPDGPLSWKKSPPVDASTLAAHQVRLTERAGESAERQGNVDEAIRLYEQARSLDPGAAHLSRHLAMLYDQQGDDPRAQAAYAQALAQSPDDPDLINDIGMYHLRRSQGVEAESWFRRALTLRPTHQRAANNLGISLAVQGRMEESFVAFSQVAGPAAAYSNLGAVLMQQGKTDQAREHFRRALEHDGSLQPAANLIAQFDRASSAPAEARTNSPVQRVGYNSEIR